ncbi:MAG: DUF1844 domain-containing protein [Acidimicrobiia bacterium]|nr:DUF1844 domain-containing protein [Acidimicrobiia bacterium]MYC57365.1 DUF1844 domain-containing protein [Acidimicrobiia bacterium]MYG94568.1 DUF1844 domain-containing protein [Acidimicrobiia bacterium]MYI31149.1 DUF1844 domain-containing protein [Acidimicrobiia bacterium]
MSTLWTPGGEVPVGNKQQATQPKPNKTIQPDPTETADGTDQDPLASLSEEERAQAEAIAQQMAEAREQIANTPASVVVGNHAMGLYELGAIHLSQQPPKVEEARLAIDALGVLLDGLQGRLGTHETTLRDALHQIRMAFVQISKATETAENENGSTKATS